MFSPHVCSSFSPYRSSPSSHQKMISTYLFPLLRKRLSRPSSRHRPRKNVAYFLHLCSTILNIVSENVIVLAPSKTDAPAPSAPKKAKKTVGQASSKEIASNVPSHLRVATFNAFSDSENIIIPAPSVPTMARTPVIRASSTKRPAASRNKGMRTPLALYLSNTIQPMMTTRIANPA